MGQEKSDDRVVPEGFRKIAPTARKRGGKAVTASKETGQLELFPGAADSPSGDETETGVGRPMSVPSSLPRPGSTKGKILSAREATIEEVARHGNLLVAFAQVASNKGAPGVDGQSVEEVRENLPAILSRLRHSLLNGNYRPGNIRRVWIPKAGGGQRGLGIPNVVDRIVQQGVLQALKPVFEPLFHPSSHGFRPERSCHTAILEAKTHLEEGYEWVVDFDLSKFFDRVNHQRLMARLQQRVSDRRLLRLILQMLKAKVVMPDGVVVGTEEGAPQGGPLSPLLSNIVLDELDWELERRGHRFVRYADDCNVYVRSERAGKRVMANIVRFLERRLRLKINESKSAVARPRSRHFVGFRLVRGSSGKVGIRLSSRSHDRVYDKVRELTPRNWGRSLNECIQRINTYLRGWIGFFGICTYAVKRTLQQIDARIRRRLRAIVLKQCKRKRTMVRRMIKLGVSRRAAWRGIYKEHRSIWALSHTPVVERGLSNSWFAEKDLLSLEDEWKRGRRTRARVSKGIQLDLFSG